MSSSSSSSGKINNGSSSSSSSNNSSRPCPLEPAEGCVPMRARAGPVGRDTMLRLCPLTLRLLTVHITP
eukprot:14927780-Heterocapsa_arctica.AAC.1